jgi:glycosyltransferase involved in cell wall biosynthesis
MSRILIATAQVPFVRGGNELLVEGLRDALRAAGHSVDVVALPFQWTPVTRIAESALAWRLLDISQINGEAVDLVIATKFPSYLVRHRRKVLWLVHQHRQAYDWYGTPFSDFSGSTADRAAREQILRMDQRAFAECSARFTISRNVSGRLKRFNNVDSTPLYPPSRYAGRLVSGPYGDYLLSASRLDRAKRLDLLLRALALTAAPLRLIVAGTGPERAALERLSGELGLTERVEFRGFVTDEELIGLYAGARAVYYAPIDEDYGFATVEAFAAGKPVITTHDAGGVLEFVRHGETGLIAAPEPAAIAQQLTRIADSPALAAALGQAGRPLTDGISWQNVVTQLLGTADG